MTTRQEREALTTADLVTRSEKWIGVALRATVPWCLVAAGSLLVLQLTGWREGTGSVLWWLWATVDRIALVLPFAMFASGIALRRAFRKSRRLVRTAFRVGIAASALSYVLAGWIEPAVQHRYLVGTGPEAAARTQFGPQTPVGLLRNLRFIDENPPEEYSLSVDAPDRHPPNVLWWVLHRPAALAVFGLLNVFLGLLTAQLTADLRRRSRRNARVGTGVFGGMLFFACVGIASPIEPFLRDGTLRSGVVSAWAPLALPLTEALLLCYLIRRRRG